MDEREGERPTPQEAGRAGCELLLLIIGFVLALLLFGPVMMVIAPLDQVGQDDMQTIQRIGEER